MKANIIQAATIDAAWREAMWLCVREGYDFLVRGGSYVGQVRRQLEYVTIIISQPDTRPLAPILPPHIPAPTSEEKICAYFVRYIMSSQLEPNEEYTYGEFIQAQLYWVIDLLVKSDGNTNQATICIGNILTTFLDDPPCLRSISFKVVDGRLNMSLYFRSWDLFAGMPENLGGLQLLKEYVLACLREDGLMVEDGKIIAFSDGLHLYEQYFPLVDQLNTDKIVLAESILQDKRSFINDNGI